MDPITIHSTTRFTPPCKTNLQFERSNDPSYNQMTSSSTRFLLFLSRPSSPSPPSPSLFTPSSSTSIPSTPSPSSLPSSSPSSSPLSLSPSPFTTRSKISHHHFSITSLSTLLLPNPAHNVLITLLASSPNFPFLKSHSAHTLLARLSCPLMILHRSKMSSRIGLSSRWGFFVGVVVIAIVEFEFEFVLASRRDVEEEEDTSASDASKVNAEG
ncbi:uncharacterized protein EI90DRAFT_3085086 [Cantharellus anzutake]|uniref:uncharacterized protein n=1 Tax=Cantharellus anzutake TaxID=1750568 RepID=UPI001905E8DB|nr:uncharacterized protein EI90DRAFT_3085086 [Cantharellus anzutake]KAF8317542.1 hypothetical protein EI90DRAFT_3085086 [Cantharellus anzutake]